MADGDNIFVYMGGEQEVPLGITHAVIDPSVNTVRRDAFRDCQQLVSIIFHDDVELIEYEAFRHCSSLRGIKLLGVREIRYEAFHGCSALLDVEFGDKLETLGEGAFHYCRSLRSIKSLSVRSIGPWVFSGCKQLEDAEFGIDLESVGIGSFNNCHHLQRITIPLKDNLFPVNRLYRRCNQFDGCKNLSTIDPVGAKGIHSTISSFLLETWIDEINEEFDRIKKELPISPLVPINRRFQGKAEIIQQWIRSVSSRMDHYKAEHNRLLKEHMTLLELAVWKAKLDETEDSSTLKVQTKRAKIDEESTREEKRITSGADIIIKNVLPFLKLA